ncbi:MAG: mechanosensitive ion channel family protein [Armatimonadota bacterium]
MNGEDKAAEEAVPAWIQFMQSFSEGGSLAEKLGVAVMVIVLALLTYWIVHTFIARARRRLEQDAEEADARSRQRLQRAITVLELVGNVAKWIIGIGAVLWLLVTLGVPIAPLLAGAGIIGIAFGFGSQTLVKDLISGLFLLIEGQHAVGDYVEISGKFGLVEAIGLRVTVLKDLDNQLHYLPNGTITAITVYEEPFVNYMVEVPVSSDGDAKAVMEKMQEVIADMKDEFPQHLPLAGPVRVDRTESGQSVVRIPVGVFPTQEWLANEAVPARANQVLQELEITLPPGRQVRTYADLSRMPLPPKYEDVEHTATTLGLDCRNLFRRLSGEEMDAEENAD